MMNNPNTQMTFTGRAIEAYMEAKRLKDEADTESANRDRSARIDNINKIAERWFGSDWTAVRLDENIGWGLITVDELVFKCASAGYGEKVLTMLIGTCPDCGQQLWSNELYTLESIGRAITERGHERHHCPKPIIVASIQSPPTWQENLANAIVAAIEEVVSHA